MKADVARIEAAWAGAQKAFGQGRPSSMARFSAADAMFAPVVNRFDAYAVPVAPATRAYMDAVMALPAWKAWIAGGEAEPWRIEKSEAFEEYSRGAPPQTNVDIVSHEEERSHPGATTSSNQKFRCVMLSISQREVIQLAMGWVQV